ncbi:MAG: penicillin acylase family protein, partial [Acidobacteriota bacterium]
FNHSLGGDFNVPAAGGWEHLSEQLQGVGRSGGYETVDASGHSARADSDRRFMFGGGPARRFVAEMNPSGIEAYQIIPGGYGGDSAAAAGTVQLGRWLTNRYRRIPLQLSEIEAQQTAEFTLVPDSYGLQFPFFQGDSQFFTAIAVVNRVASNLEMEFTAWSPSGSLLEFPENPRLVELPPGRQWARLGGEIFGIAPTDPQSGWIELKLTSSDGEPPSVGSFTQFGDFELRQLDGATAVQSASRLLYFPRVFEGPAAVLGQASGTWISVANPGVGPVQMTIEFVPLESTGSSSRERLAVDRELNSKGVLFERLSELFDVAELPLGYLRVVVTEGEGVVGFELIRLLESGTLIGVNGLPSGATRKLYSAQMAIAETVFTNVSLINTSEFDRTVGLRFLPQGGGGALEASPLQLSPGQSVQFDPSALLPIDSVPQSGSSPSSVPLVGSLEIRIDGPGVIGDVLFGDPDTLKFGAALPLQSQPFQEAIFGHVANLGQFFTGVALFNPNAETAEVKLEVFSSEGELKGTKNLSLAAGDRLSQVLTELVSESANQAGGYIRVTSDRGIIGQELFGTMDLRLQSAVPPTVEK